MEVSKVDAKGSAANNIANQNPQNVKEVAKPQKVAAELPEPSADKTSPALDIGDGDAVKISFSKDQPDSVAALQSKVGYSF